MNEKTKPEKEIEEKEDSEAVKDQKERDYYYDDSCGYETFVDENDSEEESD